MMLNTYVVDGGIGKNIAFTALIPKLAERDGQAVQIHTPYLDCFAFNRSVHMAYEQTIPLTDHRMASSDNIFYSEPYKSNFVKGGQHLIESFCEILGIEYSADMTPKIYTSHLEERADAWLEKAGISGKFMVVQFSGGQAPINFQGGPYQSIMPLRNYPQFLAQKVIAALKAEYPNIEIIDFSLPNEPQYSGAIQYEEHWAVMHEILKKAEGFIGIDSMLQHMSASAKKSGVVIWGQSRWTQFGYSHNKNLSFHMKGKWDESKFDEADPRNVCVDPDVVVKAYKELMRKGNKSPSNIQCMSA